MLRRKTCAVLRARTCALFRANTKETTEGGRPKAAPWCGTLGGDIVSIWGALGTLLGGCGGHLGSPWGAFGTSWAALGCHWELLRVSGVSLGCLGGFMLLKHNACAHNMVSWNSSAESLESREVVSRRAVQTSPSTRARW